MRNPMQQAIHQAVLRIESMEALFDRLLTADREDPGYQDALAQLVQYYESGLWLQDYTLDEQELLPRDIKRGILSQDALYDFLENLS